MLCVDPFKFFWDFHSRLVFPLKILKPYPWLTLVKRALPVIPDYILLILTNTVFQLKHFEMFKQNLLLFRHLVFTKLVIFRTLLAILRT